MGYMGGMRHAIALTLCLGLALPAAAQEAGSEGGATDMDEGFSLLEEGTRLLLRGLMAEMEPALRELQGALQNLDAYHPPEVLPNGDILIRRKEPLAGRARRAGDAGRGRGGPLSGPVPGAMRPAEAEALFLSLGPVPVERLDGILARAERGDGASGR